MYNHNTPCINIMSVHNYYKKTLILALTICSTRSFHLSHSSTLKSNQLGDVKCQNSPLSYLTNQKLPHHLLILVYIIWLHLHFIATTEAKLVLLTPCQRRQQIVVSLDIVVHYAHHQNNIKRHQPPMPHHHVDRASPKQQNYFATTSKRANVGAQHASTVSHGCHSTTHSQHENIQHVENTLISFDLKYTHTF